MIHARISANAEKHMALKRQRLSIPHGAVGFHIAEGPCYDRDVRNRDQSQIGKGMFGSA